MARQIYSLDSIPFQSGLGDGAWALYGLTRAALPKVCVEIGSARGLSACYVGLALKHNGFGKLYAIDPHTRTEWNDLASVDTLTILKRNLSRCTVADFVDVIPASSEEAAAGWDRSIDLLFIDGDHTYEGCKADWERFLPFMSKFGLVVFHDTTWDLHPNSPSSRSDMGVPRVVDELRQAGYPVVSWDSFCGMSIVQPSLGGVELRTSVHT